MVDDQPHCFARLRGAELLPIKASLRLPLFAGPASTIPRGCVVSGNITVGTVDPIYITVDSTFYYALGTPVMDGCAATDHNGSCWHKDAAGYIWPADTQWYTDQCDDGGTVDYDQIDGYYFAYYHNDDWGDDNVSTSNYSQPGEQITLGGWVNWNQSWEPFGEDSSFLSETIDHQEYNSCSAPDPVASLPGHRG